METLTRCMNCLRLSQQRNGQCTPFVTCVTTPEKVIEDRAKFLFTCHGYRLTASDSIWITTHDEPETGWEGVWIASYQGSYADAYRLLMAHRFPTDRNIQCVECHDVDVADLGDSCESCARQEADWIKADA